MTVITELAAAAQDRSANWQQVSVQELRAGMAIALRFREFHLPWLVLAEPVPVSPGLSMVMIRRIQHGQPAGVPVGISFDPIAVVHRLPRHYGVCSRCGALSPCVDEWVESALLKLVDLNAPPAASSSHEGVVRE